MYAYSQSLRDELLAGITDADLEFSVSGHNPRLLELFLELGTTQGTYTRAFRELRLRFDLTAPSDVKTVADLNHWFSSLDAEMLSALEALSNEDFAQTVARGSYQMPLQTMFYTFREAILITCAKVNVYFMAMNKPIPKQNQDWIG